MQEADLEPGDFAMNQGKLELADSPIKSSMKVGEMMTASPVAVSHDTALRDALARMDEHSISSVLIEKSGSTVGILTERDAIRAISGNLPPEVPVDRIMSTSLVTVDINMDIHNAYHKMLVSNIHHLVVVDQSGNSAGILTETNFRKYNGLENFIAFLDVSSAMSHQYVMLERLESPLEVASAMQRDQVDCALIVENLKPVSLVTLRDMVRLYSLQKQLISDVMSTSLVTVSPQTLLIDSARLMHQKGIRHLVVVDESGHLLGMLNERDIFRHMEDEYIVLLQDLIRNQARELSEDRFRTVINQINHRVLIKDPNSVFVSCNESLAKDLGASPDEIVGKTDFDFFPRELAERYREDDQRVIRSGERIEIEEPYIIDGRNRWINTSKSPLRSSSGEITGIVVVLSDITERREAEEQIARRNWALKALSDSNKALVYSESEQELIEGVCRAIASNGVYPLAWIGWKKHDSEQSVTIVASAGVASEYADKLKISWGDSEYGLGPSGTAVRTERIVLENDFDQSESFHPWMARAKAFNLRSSVAIPVAIGGVVSGVLTVYASIANAFSESAIVLFQELVANLAFGIESRRTKKAYDRAMQEQVVQAKKLEKAFEDSLMAISSTLEQRDPYTAGHERNVAELAVKIGKRLGWDERRLQGLYFAGIVHDLGKIQIPVEILTKPGRLTPAEFSLIKIHPETGYNILKNIEFPWPIAEMIRQHHEYLDGSGYPRGLTQGQILDEAKILTVADIFDSMSSARPYRAALGKDKAIEEIRRLSGTRLDPSVVEAFLEIADFS